MSENLKFGTGGGPGNRSVFGYPDRWVWAKDNVGVLPAYKSGQDFFHVLWQVNARGQVDLRVESPTRENHRSLNDIKCEIIEALLASKLGDKGYHCRIGGAISQGRNAKSTKVFRVMLPDDQLKSTSTENIQAVHDALGSTVDKSLLPFRERLEKCFR